MNIDTTEKLADDRWRYVVRLRPRPSMGHRDRILTDDDLFGYGTGIWDRLKERWGGRGPDK